MFLRKRSSSASSSSPGGTASGLLEPIVRDVNLVSSTLQVSLEALRDAAALATNVPYIALVAGILLQAIRMADEVKQYKDTWDRVMRKLSRIAGIVVYVGESCQKHGLKEGDLPSGLRTSFQTLQSELSGIQDAVTGCVSEVRGFRRFLLRRTMAYRIAQYDEELSDLLQTFQVELALDGRFSQIVQERNTVVFPIPAGMSVPPAGLSDGITDATCFTQQKPSTPQIFFGRDEEVAHILEMIFKGLGSSPARVAILGPGGIGKTTLASAVLTHERVRNHFGQAVYFVPCESTFSSGALLIQIGKALGVFDGGADGLASRVNGVLQAAECILCLDNFESPWDQADTPTRHAVEELLSGITDLRTVTVLITMRGAERPAQTRWSQPFLAPLRALDSSSAKAVWEHIAGQFDSFSEILISEVGYVPLAVTLLAHLAQATSSALLSEEWNRRNISLVQKGQKHRLSNLEFSIQLSIESERMKANPSAKVLLGVLSLLPDGMHFKQLKQFEELLVGIALIPTLAVLQQCSLINQDEGRFQTHPLIRHFCKRQSFVPPAYEAALVDFYVTLTLSKASSGIDDSEAALEVNNTKAILFHLLDSGYKDHDRALGAIVHFTSFCIRIGDFSEGLLEHVTLFAKRNDVSASLLVPVIRSWSNLLYFADDLYKAGAKAEEGRLLCLTTNNDKTEAYGGILSRLGDVHLRADDLVQAETRYMEALSVYQTLNDLSGVGNAYASIAGVYERQNKLDDAEEYYKKCIDTHAATEPSWRHGHHYRLLGDLYTRRGDLDEAERLVNKALALHRQDGVALSEGNDLRALAEIFLRRMKLDEAEAYYQAALDIHTRCNDAAGQGCDYNGLGMVYMEKRDVEKARDMLERALTLHTQSQDKIWVKFDADCLNNLVLQ